LARSWSCTARTSRAGRNERISADRQATVQYFAVACDYDETLAEHGRVSDRTVHALEELRRTGRKLILVSGRQLDDLFEVFPSIRLFNAIVAENGGVLHDASTGNTESLADPPSDDFVTELRRQGVTPLSVGRVIVATWEPNQQTVLQVIHALNLELQVIFNKGAVMILPTGVNKASGMRHALDRLKLSPHNAVAIGDAENDLAFLASCDCAVAVANALDSVKARAHWVTSGAGGDGVIELANRLIESDLKELNAVLPRRRLSVGRTIDGDDIHLQWQDGNLLAAGPSGAGKTSLTTALLESLCKAQFQFCVVDPEGDYDDLACTIPLRSNDQRTLVDETMRVLDHPGNNAVANLLDLRVDDRPTFLHRLLPRILELQSKTGRPHWIVIDEAHHLLPASESPTQAILKALENNVVLVTVHPDHVARPALAFVTAAAIVGREPERTLEALARGRGEAEIGLPPHEEDPKLMWWLRVGSSPVRFQPIAPAADRQRHHRKYAEGELGEDRSFYFRGPNAQLNLRAQNLDRFMQIGDGVDDPTWDFHLRRHDISRWFRDVIKDEELAADTAAIEDADLDAADSRKRIRHAIERRYTTPA
jgi:hydroxymethylpyrimidine pyrophosphatase-like HAD family hydrolase